MLYFKGVGGRKTEGGWFMSLCYKDEEIGECVYKLEEEAVKVRRVKVSKMQQDERRYM